MTTPIDPNLINEGDPVVIQDADKNVARGTVEFDHEGRMLMTAFKVQIPFARWSTSARGGLGGYAPVKGIKIVGHQPPIDQMIFDVIPKQKFRSNPT